jgi:hypothetical protein
MTTKDKEESGITDALMRWVFGPLISILGTIIILLLNDMRSDIKQLVIQSASDKIRIDNLERVVYPIKMTPQKTTLVRDTSSKAIAYTPTLFIHKELYDINKYMRKRI